MARGTALGVTVWVFSRQFGQKKITTLGELFWIVANVMI